MSTEYAISFVAGVFVLLFLLRPLVVLAAERWATRRGRPASSSAHVFPAWIEPGGDAFATVVSEASGQPQLIVSESVAPYFEVSSLRIDGHEQLAVTVPATYFTRAHSHRITLSSVREGDLIRVRVRNLSNAPRQFKLSHTVRRATP